MLRGWACHKVPHMRVAHRFDAADTVHELIHDGLDVAHALQIDFGDLQTGCQASQLTQHAISAQAVPS